VIDSAIFARDQTMEGLIRSIVRGRFLQVASIIEEPRTKDEIVAHLECGGAKYLSVAIADDISNNEAARVTILAVLKR
jgi:hypothetical protein